MISDDAIINDVIGMAWCDKTSFDDIYREFNLSESDVIAIMRRELKPSSFRMWRKRVSGRHAKHGKKNTQQRLSYSTPDSELHISNVLPLNDTDNDYHSNL